MRGGFLLVLAVISLIGLSDVVSAQTPPPSNSCTASTVRTYAKRKADVLASEVGLNHAKQILQLETENQARIDADFEAKKASLNGKENTFPESLRSTMKSAFSSWSEKATKTRTREKEAALKKAQKNANKAQSRLEKAKSKELQAPTSCTL